MLSDSISLLKMDRTREGPYASSVRILAARVVVLCSRNTGTAYCHRPCFKLRGRPGAGTGRIWNRPRLDLQHLRLRSGAGELDRGQSVPPADHSRQNFRSDLALQWTGGNPALQRGNVTIVASSLSEDRTQDALVMCTAPVSTRSFTIPKRVLASLPVSGSLGGSGQISIGQYNTPTSFTATGLTRGIITDIFNNVTWVNFK